jgi:(p)ppGpp synthase/HD superfamily hydrolase
MELKTMQAILNGLIEQYAIRLAVKAHHGQVRKYTEEPYIVHPLKVANLVSKVPHSPEMIAAALLHDVVEDTEVTFDDINNLFGLEVTKLVWMVTDQSRPGDGNRATRKEIDRKHLAKANPTAKTIKLADIIDNSKDIIKYDPKFAAVYVKEARALMEVLGEGDSTLFEIADFILGGNSDSSDLLGLVHLIG